MHLAVVGLWHLGCVTTACLCKVGYNVIAYDSNQDRIEKLKIGQAPIFEPHLDDALHEARSTQKLTYTHHPSDLSGAEIIWITFDTPVNQNDQSDVNFIVNQVKKISSHIRQNAIVLISSQVPVGTTQKLQTIFPAHKNISFAYIPENLRLGKAIDIFMQPTRIIVGVSDDKNVRDKIRDLLKPFSTNLIWMSVASAEMTKHALNSFLALSVTFINEIASLCEAVGANGYEVEQGLKSEERIGYKSYLHPGDSIAGGTLMRDVRFLMKLGTQNTQSTHLITAIVKSNRAHQAWTRQKLLQLFDDLKGKKIAILGLTYKPNTNTLRRSSALETCEWLFERGCKIKAFDPVITQLPKAYAEFIELENSFQNTIQSADAVVIATPWPEFLRLTQKDFILHTDHKIAVLDPNGCIVNNIKNNSQIRYYSVGHSQCN